MKVLAWMQRARSRSVAEYARRAMSTTLPLLTNRTSSIDVLNEIGAPVVLGGCLPA